MLKKLLSTLACCFCASTALANDTSFGGEGAAIFPVENRDVRMMDEHVILNGRVEDDHLLAWDVNCTFHFKNESNKAVKLTIGFPFPKYDIENDEVHLSAPPGKEITESMIYDFKATVRGKSVKTASTKLSQPVASEKNSSGEEYGGYDYAWTWEVEFAPHEEVEIVNTYTTGVTSNSMGYILPSYVVRTGKNWRDGKIGRSIFEIRPNIKSWNLCSSSWMNLTDGEDEYLRPTIDGWKIIGKGDKQFLQWDLKNFEPEKDLEACIQSRSVYLDELMWGCKPEPWMSLEDLRICRNIPYAKYGYIFKKPEMREYFQKKWWYQENPAFTPSMLTKEERSLVADIKKAEVEKKYDPNGSAAETAKKNSEKKKELLKKKVKTNSKKK